MRYFATILILLALFSSQPGNSAYAQARAGFYYTAQKAETLASVAQRFGMTEAELARENRLQPGARLARGSRLWVPRAQSAATAAAAARPSMAASSRPATATPPRPTTTTQAAPRTTTPAATRPSAPVVPPSTPSAANTYTVRSGDSLWGVANRHGLTVNELARLNGLSSNASLQIGQVLVVRGNEVEVPGGGIAAAPFSPPPSSNTSSGGGGGSSSPVPSSRGYIWPVEGRILRGFINRADEKYTGIDIAAPRGTEVRAARDGRVIYAGEGIPSYGRMVIIQHDGGFATCYAQLDRILVKKDQQIRRGQVVGRSGDPGRGREPYLHFEIRRNGEAIDPEPFLP